MFAVTALAVPAVAETPTFTIDGTDYSYNLITQKEIGPGVTYRRIRIPDYPLNINYMVVDLTNPYNRIETQQASETLGKTETLANAYTRQREAGKKPLGAQNGNFWTVSGQGIYSTFTMGATYNANMKNGQIITETNCYSDQWDGGPARTGVVGIDYDKKLWIESMSWKGTVRADRWGASQAPEIIQVNKFCRAAGEMTLYNSFYGKDKKFQTIDGNNALVDNQTCEVLLDLNEGQVWASNKDFTATVKEVRTNQAAGTLGDYDLCLAGTSTYKTLLEQLQVGDVVTINYGWISVASGQPLSLEQCIGGNAMVMVGGELTGRNEDETYNSQVYSRSAYGMSDGGKTLYMFVIDKSTDPVYGTSAGCNTSVMCQIMKQLGVTENICNVDAGGSAQLMVQGAVVNRTTEGNPRAVANGWMVYSVAPDDDKSDVVARIEFLDPELNIPIWSTYEPVILGYNAYGELIDENVEGFTLSCDAALASADGSRVNVLGTTGTGTLTAAYNGITVTKTMNVVEADVAVRLSEFLNDGREYPVEITSKVGVSEFNCDPSRLEWTVENPEVAEMVNGVLKGLKNGTTKISGKLGTFTAEATVTVELPEGAAMPVLREFPADWKLTQLGSKNLAVTEYDRGMKITFVGTGSGRGAYLQAESEMRVWSMPKAFRVSVNPGDAAVKSITMTAVNGKGETISAWAFTETALPKNELSTFELPLEGWCDPSDVANYPITIRALRFNMDASAKGQTFEMLVPAFEAVYAEDGGAVATVAARGELTVYPNPVQDGTLHLSLAGEEAAAEVSVYNNAGILLISRTVDVSGGHATVDVSALSAGIYFVKVSTGDTTAVKKLIKR